MGFLFTTSDSLVRIRNRLQSIYSARDSQFLGALSNQWDHY